jgi:hypothetical protein
MTSSNDQNQLEPFADHIYQPVQRNTEEDNDVSDSSQVIMDAQIQRYLTKVQVLTPLAILLNIASLTVCSILVEPNLKEINDKHWTQFTPSTAFVLIYWATLFLFQIGFAVLVVLGQKEITKKTLVNGVGVRLALANVLLGLWAITWVLNRHPSYIAGLVILSVIGFLLLITALLLAVKYPPDASRPLDWLFIHVPIKMFLVIVLQLDIPQQLFMALNWTGDHHREAIKAIWPSFGIYAGMGALSAIWIFATMDFVWAACGIFLHFAVLYSNHPSIHNRKPEIIASIVLAMVLQAVAIVGSVLYNWLARVNQDQGVALGRNPQEEAHAARLEAEAEAAAAAARERALSGYDSAEGSVNPSTLEEGQNGHGVEVTRKLGST